MHRIPDPGTINHTEGALAVNRRFVPEPTVKYNVGTRSNRLIERRGKTTIELIADKTNELQYKDIIGGQGIVE